jgi:hypothetical protein
VPEELIDETKKKQGDHLVQWTHQQDCAYPVILIVVWVRLTNEWVEDAATVLAIAS